MSESFQPEEPMLKPIDGNGGGGDEPPPPPPPTVRINQVSPIAAGLAGGVEITLTGSGFQAGAQVFFGSQAATAATFINNTSLRAVLPQAFQTGSVNVSLVNPDGSNTTKPGGFTYVTLNTSGRAEVIGVEPLAIIEDLQTDVTLRGRNLIAAHNSGSLVLRGPARATLTLTNIRSTTDQATGIEELTLNVRVTASPPLASHERLIVQILASRRPQAVNDGVFESSRQMFTVLPRDVPVILGYTALLSPAKPNMVVVSGRNLSGCLLDVGASATIHIQKSDDDLVAGIVTLSPKEPAPELSVRDKSGVEVSRFNMELVESSKTESDGGLAADDGPGMIDLQLTEAPGQELVAPTEEDAVVYRTNGSTPSALNLEWSNFSFTVFEVFFRFQIVNIVRLIPFFDGGGEEMGTSIQPQVGQLFRVRGAGLLFALRIEITVTITVVIIIGFRFDVWDFGLFNEFPEFGWGIGSIVIGFRIQIRISILFRSMTALVLPNGRLQVLAVFNLEINIDFTITNNGLNLNFDPRFTHKVIFRDIKPIHPLFLCDGRFQLAGDNGQSVFPDAFGGYQSFYFVRGAGQCCATWSFDFELVRFTSTGPEITVQPPFNTELCLIAQPAPAQLNIIITSQNPAPDGIPPRLTMTFNDRATLICMAQQVDANGTPTGLLQEITTLGYNREFFLDPLGPDVLDPTLVGSGDAAPVLPGDNLIRVRIWRGTTGPIPFTFWPGAISGFDIIRQLSLGLPPAVIGSNPLPITVQNPTQITVTPTLLFTNPQNPGVPTESAVLFTNEQLPVREIERYEPFEPQQLEYRLGVKLSFPTIFNFPATLSFRIANVQMMVLHGRGTATNVITAPVAEAPLKDTGFTAHNREAETNAARFFEQLVQVNQEVIITLNSRPNGNTPIELAAFKIVPNIKDEAPNKLVPPGKAVGNREVMLLINLTLVGKITRVAPIKQLRLVVRNDETYEEYLRVFSEVRSILSGTPLENFARDLMNGLPQGAPTASFLETKGKELWNTAVTTMQTVKDDRPLYWARLQSICALRAHYKRKTTSQPTVSQFEWPSRGLEQVDGQISFAGVSGRRAIITGFDPFGLPSLVNQSNLSGMIALALHKKLISSTQGSTEIRTAILPVRYDDFDAKIVENAVSPNISSIALLMTCSQGRNFFDVDRFAGRNRGTSFNDNNKRRVEAPGTDPGAQSLENGPQFIESTLPYERVILQDILTRTGPPFDTTASFVLNQAHWIMGQTKRFPPGSASLPETYTKLPFVFPQNAIAREGSGEAFLSNESFYRTALLRSRNRPALPSGHLHVPVVGNQTGTPAVPFIAAAEHILTKFLNDVLRLRSLASVSFLNTPINRTSAPSSLPFMNETNAVVGINRVEFEPPNSPFAVVTPLPTQVNASSASSLQITFSPTEVRDYATIIRILDAAGQILFSELLTGTGIPVPPAPQITSFTPIAGMLGDSLTISGVNFTGATAVRIGTIAIPFIEISATEIEAEVSGPQRIGRVSVDTPGGTATSTSNFTVLRPPRDPAPL